MAFGRNVLVMRMGRRSSVLGAAPETIARSSESGSELRLWIAPMELKIRPIGAWPEATATFTNLPARHLRASKAALWLEARRFRLEVQAGIRSGAPGGKAFKPLSPLTIALHGAGKGILNRTETMINEVVIIREGNNVSITVRGSRTRVADIHEGGRTFKRVLTKKQRMFLFAAMKRAGITPGKGGGGGGGPMRDSAGKFLSKEQKAAQVGMTIIPARPFFGPTAAKYFKNVRAAEQRLLGDWRTSMGGKFLGK